MKKKAIKSNTMNMLLTLAMVVLFFGISYALVMQGVLGSLYQGLLIPMCVYAILAVSLNLTVGILGELSLGHAGFWCLGAYSSGIFSILTKDVISSDFLRYLIAIVIGALVAGIFGALIGCSILRLKGDYLAIVTLAFGEIIYKLIQNCYFIKDKNGLYFSFGKTIPASTYDSGSKVVILDGPKTLSSVPKTATVISSIVILLLALIFIYHLIDSRAGRAFKAIRDNSIAAQSIGIQINRYKLYVFFISAALAGVAGAVYSHNTSLEASKFNYNVSILILVFVVLGGIGSIRGSVIAAVLLYGVPELLRDTKLAEYRMIIYSLILIIVMICSNNPKIMQILENTKKKLLPKLNRHAAEQEEA